MRRPVIAGNWKMNYLTGDTKLMLEKLIPQIRANQEVDIIVAPPFLSIFIAREVIAGTNIKLAAQNSYCEDSGAFTGELSPLMLKDAGVEYIILGHSERRQIFRETDELINSKTKKVLESGLKVIFCIGETLEQRERGKTFDVVKAQLEKGLKEVSSFGLKRVIIAYEPVWAIGTGKTATAAQAEEVHSFIRNWLGEYYSPEVAESVIIQYGGSVKPENIKGLMSQENIDGALVGGASLKADSFAALVNFKDGE